MNKLKIHNNMVNAFFILIISFIPVSFICTTLFYPEDKFERFVYAKGTITNKEIVPYLSGGKSTSSSNDFVIVIDNKSVQSVTKETYFTRNVGEYIELSYMARNNFVSKTELIYIFYFLLFVEFLIFLLFLYDNWLKS